MPKAKKVGEQWSVLAYLGKDETGKKQYKRVSGSDKQLVELEASQIAIAARTASKKKTRTVGKTLDDYITAKKNIMSASTIRAYLSMREHHYKNIEDKYVEDLEQSVLQQMINEEAVDHSPKTVRNIYGLLTAALAEYYPDITFKVKLPPKNKPSIEIPTDDMINEFLTASEGTQLHTAIVLAAFLGLRRSEICALEKSDIDFKRKTLSVNKAVVLNSDGESVIKKPKTFAGERTIIMPDFIIPELKYLKTDKVISLTVTQLSNDFSYLTRKLGYKIRFHDLRHPYVKLTTKKFATFFENFRATA